MPAPKTGKKEDPGVLGALPTTRPSRLSRRAREGAQESDGAKTAPAKPAPSAKKAPAKRAATTTTKAAPKTAAKAAPKTAPKTTPKARPKSVAQAKPAAPKAEATVTPLAEAKAAPKPRKPRAVKPTTPALKEPIARAKARADDEPTDRSDAPIAQAPSGGELVSTVVQAAGELVQIGATVGGQIIKRAIERLPKP